MPQVVETDIGQPGLRQERLEGAHGVARLQRRACTRREDQTALLPALARPLPVGPLPVALRPVAERLLGGDGPAAADRLGLPPGTPHDELRAAALEELDRWRALAADPEAARATVDACAVLVRAIEGLLAALDGVLTPAGSATAQPGA